ncbi:MAG TPA: peptide deformylase [Bryobacteraceae bacterium]|jgi:peptide deformylase
MAAHRILQLGDPKLREISQPWDEAGSARQVLDDLRDTLHEFQRTHGFGRGISAIQIGVGRRVIYIEFEGTPYCLINPEYEFLSDRKFRLWDDCFSFPDLLVWLERSETLRLRYTDEDGAARRVEASGALSELIQHEMDHLDGILAVDRAIGPNGLATREQWLRLTQAAHAG